VPTPERPGDRHAAAHEIAGRKDSSLEEKTGKRKTVESRGGAVV
jgi:hypothetical protein